jgi:hypothetical protein
MMNTVIKLLGSALLLGATSTASAWGGNNGWDWNPWPVWTPMYWAEEMVGDNDWDAGPYGYSPYNSGYGPYGGYPFGGYPSYGNYGAPYNATPGPGDYAPYYYGVPWH